MNGKLVVKQFLGKDAHRYLVGLMVLVGDQSPVFVEYLHFRPISLKILILTKKSQKFRTQIVPSSKQAEAFAVVNRVAAPVL